MVDLSIIIVNYNVKYFLRQCLQSVFDSADSLSKEVWVVDNCSHDGSNEMVESEFPQVRLIKNKDNVGFSVANNQAIKQASGKYVLLLNPDTLVPNDCFNTCFDFMERNPKTGGLGVIMLDGNGDYLPESKRGFPSPWAAFCKISGLSSVFKKSALFNYYYLGHLDKDETHSIDVLSGAFMFMPKSVLDEIGYLDERFFMYGEDIDLSYRIKQSGHDVSYLPDTSIIHYKGESTKKSSINYVKHFYNAMLLFTEKHFGSKKKSGFLVLLKLGIYTSAIVGAIKNLFGIQWKLLVDFMLLIVGFFGMTKLYPKLMYNSSTYYFDVPILRYVVLFSALWVLVLFIFGHYDKRSSFRKYTLAIAIGSVIVMILYSLFPESWRFSRAFVLLSIPITAIMAFVTKKFRNKLSYGNWSFVPEKAKRILIVGGIESSEHVHKVINNNIAKAKVLGYVNPNPSITDENFLSELDELADVVEIYSPNEIIFCSKEVDNEKIFYWMSKLDKSMTYRIASKDNTSILGSDSKNRMGSWYTHEVFYKIKDNTLLRLKSLLDILMSILLFVLSPIVLIFGNANLTLYKSIFSVMLRRFSWVGFDQRDEKLNELPKLKKGIYGTQKLGDKNDPQQEDMHLLNLYYAKNYAVWQDLEIIWRNLFK